MYSITNNTSQGITTDSDLNEPYDQFRKNRLLVIETSSKNISDVKYFKWKIVRMSNSSYY